jgi:hypothetical protein
MLLLRNQRQRRVPVLAQRLREAYVPAPPTWRWRLPTPARPLPKIPLSVMYLESRRKPKERHCYNMNKLRLSLRPPFSVEFLIVWILIATKLSFMFEYGVFAELAAH